MRHSFCAWQNCYKGTVLFLILKHFSIALTYTGIVNTAVYFILRFKMCDFKIQNIKLSLSLIFRFFFVWFLHHNFMTTQLRMLTNQITRFQIPNKITAFKDMHWPYAYESLKNKEDLLGLVSTCCLIFVSVCFY